MTLPVCPLCSEPSELKFEVDGHGVFACPACRHRFHPIGRQQREHVAATYDDSYFAGGGAGYDDYTREQDLLRNAGRFYARRLSRHTQPGTLLDVGAAAGFILDGFLERGWQGQGVEPNQSMATHATGRGLPVTCSSWEDFATKDRFDLVSMIQVIAHFVDVRHGLEHARSFLEPGGHLLIETWDRSSWTAKAFGKSWHEYSPPSVLHWFTRKSLDKLVTACGFEKVTAGKPAKRIQLGHAASLIRYKMSGSFVKRALTSPLALLPKKLKVPYVFDDVFWTLYRAR